MTDTSKSFLCSRLDSTLCPSAYDWALSYMPCPAFRCNAQGAIVSHNAAAERLWGGAPPSGKQRWSGFVALWRCDGTPIAPAATPTALAATGAEVGPTELLAESLDGESRHVIFHVRPLRDNAGRPMGCLCALTDVSERRRLESKTEALEEDRTVFLSMLAHELRNPLSPILSAASIMKKISLDVRISHMAEVVERQAHQLARFITDLLSAARYNGAKDVPIEMRDSNVGEITDKATDVVASAAHARAQTLIVDAGNREVQLRCDPERIAQAIGNALLNASEHSPDTAQIRLSIKVTDDIFQARICDEGAGVEPNKLEEIFEPFKSFAHASGKEKPAGGLGLWIAKSVATAHRGVVFARSQGPGKGTTIVFALPIAHC